MSFKFFESANYSYEFKLFLRLNVVNQPNTDFTEIIFQISEYKFYSGFP